MVYSQRVRCKAVKALAFCEKNNFNTDYCLLFDVRIHSGKNRMFVWNFKNDSAFKRIVIFYSHTLVPDHEVYPYHLLMGVSQGCLLVDNSMMTDLDNLLQESKKPVLL